MFASLQDIQWLNLTTEAIFSALFDMILLGAVALYIIWKNKKALKAGRFDDMVLFSFNIIESHPQSKAPVLGFRTPLTASLTEIFHSESLIKQIRAVAKTTTDQNPIICLPDQKMHNIMQRHLVNFSNRMNMAGHQAVLTGQKTIDVEYQLALIYEPSARTKLFRVVPVSTQFFEELAAVRAELTFYVPYHVERLQVLDQIYTVMQQDNKKEQQQRVLVPMIFSTPLYHSTSSHESS